ncbi:Hypothetical predicted protein, partial [Olea europaea subsp. europaea]
EQRGVPRSEALCTAPHKEALHARRERGVPQRGVLQKEVPHSEQQGVRFRAAQLFFIL